TKRLNRCINYEKQPLITEVSLGGNTVGDGLDLINGKRSPLLKIQLVYGSPFLKDKRRPFDYFNLHLGLNLKGNETITNFYGEALIWGKNLNFQGNDSDLEQDNLIGAFQHLDYLANDVYMIAASGVGAGVISRFEALEGMNLFTSCHLSAIVMGGSNSAYASQAGRDYNLGSGFSTKFEGWLINNKYGEIYMSYLRYWLYTISGASGQESITITNGKVMIPIYRNLKLGVEYLYYHRDGLYSDYPDVSADNNEFRTFISCRF
ncbi:MAG: hypothetical protein JW996_07460, partial [Candidatus Cloacimonetes bacterium]|nr:hypothetical protein [Candidatus Cloacimonadota bacterium]